MVTVKSMCCDCWHDENFHTVRENGCDCYVAVFIKTRAVVCTEGDRNCVEPNTLVIYNKGSRQDYSADGEAYCDDYLAFECTDRIITQLAPIMDKPVFIGDSVRIDDYMHLICNAYYGGRNERVYSNIIIAMLEDVASVANNSENQSAYFHPLIELRKEIYSQPQNDWNIKIMSERMALSEPYFQEIYKKAFGTSPVADVINSRIEMAKMYLVDKNMSVAEIASRCGYNSTVHFSRQFRKITGMSPVEFRKK